MGQWYFRMETSLCGFTLAPPSPPPFEFPEHVKHMSGGLGFENFRKFAAGQTICCLAWAMVGVCKGRGGKWG